MTLSRTFALGAVATVLLGCESRHAPSVLLITIDTLRADRLGCYGYEAAETPNLDRLASQGVLFEQVGAQVPVTLPSHATILTGLTPASHGLHDNGTFCLSDDVTTITEVLAADGYETGAVIGAYVLARQFGLSQGFSAYEDSFPKSGGQGDASHFIRRPASDVVDLAVDWLESHGKERFFLWLHFFDPHTPYSPPAPYDAPFSDRPYDGEIAYVDNEVGRLLDYLRERELESSTLVLVTSDHGEGLGEHDEADHSNFVYESTLRVPLIIRCPGLVPAGLRVQALVRTLDIAPTILALLEIPVPEWTEGEDLVSVMRGGMPADTVSIGETVLPLYHFGMSPLVSVRTQRWKYIAAPRPELYDLSADAAETLNLVTAFPAVATSLHQRASAYGARLALTSTESGTVTMDQRGRLEALGYVVTSPQRVPTPEQWGGLEDPKDHAWRMELVRQAARLTGTGNADDALALLDRASEDGPWLPLVQHLEGWALFRSGRLTEAAQVLREGAARDSSYVQFQTLLGRVELLRGDAESAAEVLDKALRMFPYDPDALCLKGQALLALGRADEALEPFREALRLKPSLWAARLFAAYAFFAVGRPDSAITYASAALPLCAYPGEVHLLIGKCHEATGAWRQAAASYHRAVSLDSTLSEAREGLARSHQRTRADARTRPGG